MDDDFLPVGTRSRYLLPRDAYKEEQRQFLARMTPEKIILQCNEISRKLASPEGIFLKDVDILQEVVIEWLDTRYGQKVVSNASNYQRSSRTRWR